jgi:hypothetical protein
MNEQRIPQPGEWWCEKKGFEFRALVLCTRPLNEITLEVVYAWEERPMDFRVQVLVLSSFYDRFKPVSPEDTNPRKDCSACAAILDMRRAAGPKPRFIKFERVNSGTVYIRLDEIESVANGRIWVRNPGRNHESYYSDIVDAVGTFEKALKEDP